MDLGPFALHWLHNQTEEFKAKYIQSMVNIAAPWGGAIKALRLMTSGDNIDVSDQTDFSPFAGKESNRHGDPFS